MGASLFLLVGGIRGRLGAGFGVGVLTSMEILLIQLRLNKYSYKIK
jgi:hypothetical protein